MSLNSIGKGGVQPSQVDQASKPSSDVSKGSAKQVDSKPSRTKKDGHRVDYSQRHKLPANIGSRSAKSRGGVLRRLPLKEQYKTEFRNVQQSVIKEHGVEAWRGMKTYVLTKTKIELEKKNPPSPKQLAATLQSFADTCVRRLGLGSSSAARPQPPSQPRQPTLAQTRNRLVGQVKTHIRDSYSPVSAGVKDTANADDFATFTQSLDPFGQLAPPAATTASAMPKFKNLAANQCQGFLKQVSITGPGSDGHEARSTPSESAMDTAVGTPSDTTSGVPRMQHSIWVGGPLRASNTKQKRFMDQLVTNKQNNPGWDVCLWTDQPRAAFLSASADSDLGKMRDWAIENKISLIPADEVFAGDNAMQLQGLYRTEQIKGGTGRAAASDIMRLEIINRFGGIYCDGDKPFNRPFNDIAEHTASHGNFTAAREGRNFQNCGMCGTPGNNITKRVIDNIQENYGKPRNNLLSKKHMNRPTRMEVIMRTGPSIVRDTALAQEDLTIDESTDSQHLMPREFITPPTVYTTSWDPSKRPCHGDKDIPGMAAANQAIPTLNDARTGVDNQIRQIRQQYGQPIRNVALTPQQETALVKSVENGVTALTYGIWNNDGLFNWDLAEQHIKNSPNPELAREMILDTFRLPEMRGIANQVKMIQLPGTSPNADRNGSPTYLPESTLDMMFKGDAPLFPNMASSAFTLQNAAFMGNLQFLDYAARNDMLDLSAESGRELEVGERKGTTGSFPTRKMNVFEAATAGGQSDAVAFLASQDGFGTWAHATTQSDQNQMQRVAKYGQIDTILWSMRAMTPDQRNDVNTTELMKNVLEFKPTLNQKMNDAQMAYAVRKLADGLHAEFGGSINVANGNASKLLINAIRDGNTQLAAELERIGANLDHLSEPDRNGMISTVGGTLFDIEGRADRYLLVAQRAGLVEEMVTRQSQRYADELGTHKNAHGNAVDLQDPVAVMAHIAKGLAYANDHLDNDNSGKTSRVNGWINSVADVVNHFGGIGSSQRTPQQQALLDAATHVSRQLMKVRT